MSTWKVTRISFKNEPVRFFEIKYFFPDVKGGFDIVIGNPPYVRQESIKAFKPMFAKRIREFTVVQQIYIHISIKGLELLAPLRFLCYRPKQIYAYRLWQEHKIIINQ